MSIKSSKYFLTLKIKLLIRSSKYFLTLKTKLLIKLFPLTFAIYLALLPDYVHIESTSSAYQSVTFALDIMIFLNSIHIEAMIFSESIHIQAVSIRYYKIN